MHKVTNSFSFPHLKEIVHIKLVQTEYASDLPVGGVVVIMEGKTKPGRASLDTFIFCSFRYS